MTKSPHFDTLRSWLNEINGEKSAAGRGETTFQPSKMKENGTEKVKPGEHAKEMDEYVKKHVPADVDEERHFGRDQDELQKNIGPRQSATGEDPSVEDNYKDQPKDPGSSFPARVGTHEHKEGFDLSTPAGLQKAAEALNDLATQIMADITVGTVPAKQAEATPNKAEKDKADPTSKEASTSPLSRPAAVPDAPAGSAAPSNVPPEKAAEAGYELARLMGLSKEAADATAQSVVEETIKRAAFLADRVGYRLIQLNKKADDGPIPEAPKDDEPPMDGAPKGGPMLPPGAAGPPPVEGPGPAGPGPGDMPPAGPDGGGGGAPSPEAMQELLAALQDLGVTPEMLGQLIAKHGAPSPDGQPPADMGAKVASDLTVFRRSGKFEMREPKTAAEKQLRAEMKNYVIELLNAAGK